MQECVFCKIIQGEIPGKFLFRDEHIVAFHDINPKAPVHVLVVPARHVENLMDSEAKETLLGAMMTAVQRAARESGVDGTGYKVIINNGADSGQLVYHLHAHVLGGWKKKKTWEV